MSRSDLGAVLVTTDAYPPESGGSGWSTHALVAGLQGRGLRVEVLEVDAHGEGPVSEREFDGVVLRTLPIGKHRTASRHLLARDYSTAPVREYVAEYLRQRPDIGVVHGQHLHSGPGAAQAARASGRAALVTLRDYWPVRLDGIAWPGENEDGRSQRQCARAALVRSFGVPGPVATAGAGRAVQRLAARQEALAACHRLICVSDAVRRRVAPSLRSPIDVIPNMVDPQHSAAAAARGAVPPEVRSPYVFLAGKLNAAKGFDLVVGELAAAGCKWPVVVAGTGGLAVTMEKEAESAGLTLVPLGWTDGDTLLRLAREARAVVVPSAWEEPLARVILEAMSVATPVIARATGGSPEAITRGSDGFLYETVDELSAALAALEDDVVAERMGAAALTTCAARYAPAVVLDQVIASYGLAQEAVADE